MLTGKTVGGGNANSYRCGPVVACRNASVGSVGPSEAGKRVWRCCEARSVTVRGTYGFGLRCQSDDLTAILLAPEAITFDDAQRFKQLSPIMLLRIDNGEVLELDALVESSEGQLRVGAAIDVATAHDIAKARRRVAAALSLQGKQYHEHQFGVSGSSRAVGQMLKGCNLPQP